MDARVILCGMKTAVSLPDPLFRRAERVARQRKLSRSALYQRAIEAYLSANEGDVTEQINAALAEIGDDPETRAWVTATQGQARRRRP